jgi:hypothetical protein
MPDLSFSMGGDISAFERAMAQAITTSNSTVNRMQALFKQGSDRIDQQFGTSLGRTIGSVGKLDGALGALKIAGGVFLAFEILKSVIDSVQQSAQAAGKDLEHLVEIGNKARDAQVGTSFFQAFTGSAKSLGLDVSQAEAILTQARTSLDTKIGEGSDVPNVSSTATDRVKQNVMAGNLPVISEQDLAAASTMEDRIKVILNLITELQAKGANVAAFDLGGKVFGDDFETKLRAGVDIVGTMRQALDGVAATEQGRVRTNQEIADAQRIALDYADQNRRIAALWADYEALISEYNQGNLQILDDIRGVLVTTAEEVKALIGLFEQAGTVLKGWGVDLDHFDAQVAQLLGAGKLHDFLQARGLTFDAPTSGERSGGSEVTRNLSSGVRPPTAPTDNPTRDTSKALPSLSSSGGGASAAKAADQVADLIKSLDKSAAAEKGEAAAVGLSNKAKQESIDLSKADEAAKERGTALTDAERIKVLAAADAYTTAKKQIDDYNNSQQKAAEQAKFFGDTFETAIDSVIVKGATLQSVMVSVIQSLESAALKAAILGEGPLASLFGTAPAAGATGSASVGGLYGLLSNGAGSLTNFQGWMPHFADGGRVGGVGGPRSDTIHAMVSPGEYIVNAQAAGANGGLLDAINSGRVRRYADGGSVMPSMPNAVTPSKGSRGAPAGQSQTIHFNVTSPDAPSFVRSEGQITAMLSRAAARGQRNL